MENNDAAVIVIVVLIIFGGMFVGMAHSEYQRTECVKAMAAKPLVEIQLVCGK